MFFGETLNSQSVSLIFLPPLPSLSSINGRRQTVSEMLEGTGERRGGGTCNGLGSHPGGVAILLVAQCYGNWDKHGLFHSIVSSSFCKNLQPLHGLCNFSFFRVLPSVLDSDEVSHISIVLFC